MKKLSFDLKAQFLFLVLTLAGRQRLSADAPPGYSVNWFLSAATIIALLAAGCGSLNVHPVETSILYHDAQNGFTFSLPASWKGYSVLVQQWEGQAYSAAKDQLMVTGHG